MISIYSRTKNDKGQWRFVRVNERRGAKQNPTGPFYIRYSGADGKQTFQPAGSNLPEVFATIAKLKASESAKPEVETGGNLLRSKIEKYIAEIAANKSPKTAIMYRNTLRYFQASCTKKYAGQIDRDDMLKFKTDLRNEKLSERSVYNNFLNTMMFLKWCGVKPGVLRGDWPDKVEREPEEYTEEEIVALLNAARPSERLMLNSFLCSAIRSGELAHLTYGDIDFKHSVWTICSKDGWKTKTASSQRKVPVAQWLTKKIGEQQAANNFKSSDLIFPNIHNKPNLHLERVVKRVAKRAEIGGRVDDHKFRSTEIGRAHV